jgi:hypothetical protein
VREALRQLRGLLLGETWQLPLAVALAVAAAAGVRAAAGPHSWFTHAGGFVLLGLVLLALTVTIQRPRR